MHVMYLEPHFGFPDREIVVTSCPEQEQFDSIATMGEEQQ